MAQHGDQYGRQSYDQFGNPIHQTDEYGNPIHRTGGGTLGDYGATTEHGTDQYSTAGTTGAYKTDQYYGTTSTTGAHGTHGGSGLTAPGITDVGLGGHHHHRSGSSSSSSSSKDDGHGARRKKALKGKIKEKLPGGHSLSSGGYQDDYCGAERPRHEKKGIMEKIKEKLPGGHRHHDRGH